MRALGVRTAVAEVGTLAADVAAVGSVKYDASTIRDVYAPTDAWVDGLGVHAVGEPVQAGKILAELYSPSLATVDQQYLGAMSGGIAPPINPYAGGLRALGLTEEMMEALRAKRRAPGHIPFRAAGDGVVTQLDVRLGAVVKQGERLLRTASTDPVWVELALPEALAGQFEAGLEVSLTAPAYPGRRFLGRVALLEPELDAGTRTQGVRVVVPNPDGALRFNMFVSAVLHSAPAEPVLTVPTEAVIRGERADRVIIVNDDGTFGAREVWTGRVSAERVAISRGLVAGEHVVTSGQFLLDSETNLKSGLARMDGGGSEAPEPGHEHPTSHEHHHP